MEGGAAQQQQASSSSPPSNRRVRCVVVAYGYSGRRFHCPLIRSTNRLELYGVVVRSPQLQEQARLDLNKKASKGEGVKIFDTLDAALADEQVELVVLATP